MKKIDLRTAQSFVIGVNYWASHAGTNMWRDWRPDVIADDLKRLAAAGLQLIRVFPLWPDFQPIQLLRSGGGQPMEIRFGEEPLPDTEAGQAGLSEEMLTRFRLFLDIAHTHGLACDVGLLTGWMSGRLFVPPALEGRNPLTDSFALRWAVRFVRHFIRRFRDHPAIAAWDLGNECNCMGAATRDEAYAWTALIAHTIRQEDPAHPILSGMHGLSPEGAWSIFDQAELCDLLTTHPYPLFTPHCDQDPLPTIRPILHSTAESRYYADLGGKPCLCQELGTLGPLIASEEIAAQYVRAALFSLWAHDVRGFLWWCAHDQTELTHAPYDWHAIERELGLLRADKSPKPVLETITAFRQLLEEIAERLGPESGGLPAPTRQAVCILTQDQDHWGVAYSAFILAKQAGFDLEFQYATQPIREASLYLLPCLSGAAMMPRRRMQELLARIAAGATLYLSLDTGLPSQFEALTGLEPQTRERRTEYGPITLKMIGPQPQIPSGGGFKIRFRATRAEILAIEEDGNPAFSVVDYGRGRVYCLALPLELMIARTPGVLHRPDAPPFWRIYRYIAQEIIAQQRIVQKQHPLLGLTEHPLGEGRWLIVGVNYSPEPLTDTWKIAPGYQWAQTLYGDVEPDEGWLEICVPANDGLIMLVEEAGREPK